MATRKDDPSNGKIIGFERRFVDTDKGSVKIRTRERANGNFVIYLDIYEKGKRRTEVLLGEDKSPLYLWPERRGDYDARTHNNEVWELAKIAKARFISDGQVGDRKKRAKGDFFAFLDEVLDEYKARAEEKDSVGYYETWLAFKKMMRKAFGEGEMPWHSVNKDMVKKFRGYIRRPDAGQYRALAKNSIRTYEKMLRTILRKAEDRQFIGRNPFTERLERAEDGKVCFLTVEEVKSLMRTPCERDIIKRGFLFSCFVGLRFSDIIRLRWSDIHEDDVLGKVLDIEVKKTGKPLRVSIPSPAISLLEGLDDGDPDALVFPFRCAELTVARHIDRWAKAAGIKKKVRFHVARHTCATLLLAEGVALSTISDILGHSNIMITKAVYAKVLDTTKKKAADALGNAFADFLYK